MEEIIDTFPSFLAYWSDARAASLDAQIDGWASEYMSQWPDLLSKQIDDYASQDVDWRKIARDKVFPFLDSRLSEMEAAHSYLLEACPSIHSDVRSALDYYDEVLFVIYVGIGCGAGWATTFRDRRAILFGLENIAECGWSDPEAIEGLVVHELGHIIHQEWRAQSGRELGSGPWWQLYEEGFAQRIEYTISGKWHQSTADDDWLDWCTQHLNRIARRFLQTVSEEGSVKDFFGSWYQIDGRRQTGYFLGHEVIRALENDLTLNDIASLDDIERHLRPIVERIASLGE